MHLPNTILYYVPHSKEGRVMAKHNRIKKIERRAKQRWFKINGKGLACLYSNIIKKQEEQVNGRK